MVRILVFSRSTLPVAYTMSLLLLGDYAIYSKRAKDAMQRLLLLGKRELSNQWGSFNRVSNQQEAASEPSYSGGLKLRETAVRAALGATFTSVH